MLRLPIVKEGFPFIGIGLVVTFLLGYFVHPVAATRDLVFPQSAPQYSAGKKYSRISC